MVESINHSIKKVLNIFISLSPLRIRVRLGQGIEENYPGVVDVVVVEMKSSSSLFSGTPRPNSPTLLVVRLPWFTFVVAKSS